MDSEHRHELKRNELVVFLSNLPKTIKHLPELIKNNLWTACCIAVIIIAIFMWIFKDSSDTYVRNVGKQAELTSYYQSIERSKVRIQNEQDTVGSIIAAVESIESATKNVDTAAQEAIALIKAADGIRSELHYRTDEITAKELETKIVTAREKYKIALNKAGDYSTAAAMAEFGLGLCDEEIRDFDAATQKYEAIVANADYANTALPSQAALRLKFIADYKTDFTFDQPAVEAVAEDATTEEVSPTE